MSKLSRFKEILTLSIFIITYSDFKWRSLVSSFLVKFFLSSLHVFCILPVQLWHYPALLFWFSVLLFFTSDCLLLLLLLGTLDDCSRSSFACYFRSGLIFFLWINKLLLPLCSCLFVSMVHLHVSFVITVGGVFLTALFITICGGGSFPVPGCVISCWCCVWLSW